MLYLWAFAFFMIYIYMYYSDPNRVIDKMFPGPIRVPFFGNALSFITTPSGIYQLYLNLPKCFDYKTFRMWLLHKPAIVVPDYKVAKLILNSPKCIDKAEEYRFLDSWLGDQFVFTGPEKVWKKGRKFISPAFHFEILKQYFPIFDTNSKILSKKLESHDGKESFDFSKYSTLYALDNICEAVMGVNFQTQNDPESAFAKALKNIIMVVYNRILFLWLRFEKIFKISSSGRLQEKSLKILHGYSNKVIQERKLLRQLIQNNIKEETEFSSKQNNCLLDTILETSQDFGYGNQEIRQTVDGLMFAGHDTITATLNFLFYALAKHQDVQEKLYQELDKIFQNSDRCPTYDDLQEMKYMEQTIKETLRLYTVSPIIGRKASEDFYINKNQYIPKNTTIAIFIGAIHRDPEIWPDPDKFDPERFSPEASQNRDPNTFLAFSTGPRNCLGIRFAMFELKTTLCRILRNFKLSLSDNPRDKMKMTVNFIMFSSNGIRIKVESRNAKNKVRKSG